MYTDEKNVLILIALLKANGINRIIASPGTTNMTFVSSLQNDDYFKIISCVDERSAAYLACGLASDGNPVVITCTGATASRNYLPGLTEAFYRKLPIMAVCGHRGVSSIGHLIDQQIDRRVEPNDISRCNVWLPFVKDDEDEEFCINEGNKAILSLFRLGGGPVVVNLCTRYSQKMTVDELPEVPVVCFHSSCNSLPPLPTGRIAIFAGEHSGYSETETSIIDAFCESHNAVVFCDHSSGYYGRFAIHAALFLAQKASPFQKEIDLLISIGEISGDYYSLCLSPKTEWRVSQDGELRNRFHKLSRVFEMPIENFFSSYSNESPVHNEFYKACKEEYYRVFHGIPELPFGNIWIAQTLSSHLPSPSFLQLGILNSLRSWNFFELPKGVKSYANVGGFGIDGTLSTVVGRSLLFPDYLHFCVLGDLSFFYDLNSLGNRHVGRNLRILLINNGIGAEFCNYGHPAYFLSDSARPNIAAEGHFGNKSKELVRGLVSSLGFRYLTASNKEEFLQNVSEFISTDICKSIIFEVFVDSKNEDIALQTIINILLPIDEPKDDIPLFERVKQNLSETIGKEKIKALKVIFGH